MYASHILNTAHEVFTITVAGLFITIVEAVAYVMSGMYGDPKEIGYFFCSVIVLQLFIAGIICILLVCQLAQTGIQMQRANDDAKANTKQGVDEVEAPSPDSPWTPVFSFSNLCKGAWLEQILCFWKHKYGQKWAFRGGRLLM